MLPLTPTPLLDFSRIGFLWSATIITRATVEVEDLRFRGFEEAAPNERDSGMQIGMIKINGRPRGRGAGEGVGGVRLCAYTGE